MDGMWGRGGVGGAGKVREPVEGMGKERQVDGGEVPMDEGVDGGCVAG